MRSDSGLGRPRHRVGEEGGQALVEFAIVLPVLMLVILGIIKFGVIFNNYLTLTDAVRSGARQLAVERGQVDPCGDTVTSVQNAAGGLTLANLTITVEADATNNPGQQYVSPPGAQNCATQQSGYAAKVIATYPCNATIFGIDFLPGCTLSASATERTE